jgi:pyridoxamine 5'-phosphate oxidase
MIFNKEEDVSTLEAVLDSSWKMLHQGAARFRHPFHHPALATLNIGTPEVRTVILREFSQKDRTLTCYSDARTPKVVQIRNNPFVTFLFYHPRKMIQLRLSGTASVHTDDETADAQWGKVGLGSRINYCAEDSPGTHLEKPAAGLPDFLLHKVPKVLDLPEARKNFAAIVCRFDQMDWLSLKLTGNLRAKFQWEDNRLNASWVIP